MVAQFGRGERDKLAQRQKRSESEQYDRPNAAGEQGQKKHGGVTAILAEEF